MKLKIATNAGMGFLKATNVSSETLVATNARMGSLKKMKETKICHECRNGVFESHECQQ
jgi:hypothetical protein